MNEHLLLPNYYVYTHSIDNVVFYVGKGKYESKDKYNRANTFKGRNTNWNDVVCDNYSDITVSIIVEDLSHRQALDIERYMIQTMTKLTNITSYTNG